MLVCCSLWGQQEAHYTHFMNNKLAINPAYAGSKDVASISALYRMQWVGMEEAPQTQTLYAHMPMFKDRVGLGVGLIHDTHGVTKDWRGSVSYAYRIRVGDKGKLSLGLNGSIHAQEVNWTLLRSNDQGDNALPQQDKSKYLPNFGAGVYYYSNRFYAGVSIPNLLKNNLSFTSTATGVTKPTEIRHFYMMAGVIFGNKVKVKPGILLKYVENAPFDFDANVSVLFAEKFWVGATYRLQDAVAGLVGYQLGDQLRLGVSYDYTISELRNYNNGSFEVLAEYLFRYKNKKFTNPRFFF